MKKLNKAPLIAAMSTAMLSTLTAGVANAEANPFAITEMSQGYMQVAGIVPAEKAPAATEVTAPAATEVAAPAAEPAKQTEGACGEAKCGAMMKDGKMKEGMEKMCGAMMKGKEGACGTGAADKAPADAAPAAKAGEMACGAAMKHDGMSSKDMEAACGAKMK